MIFEEPEINGKRLFGTRISRLYAQRY